MHKTMILLIPLLVIGAFAGDCSNPLLKTFGFVGFSTPTTVSGLKYCKSLQSGQSCCSDSIINNFQVKTNQTQTRLLQMVAARDQALADTRIQFIGDFNDVAVSFTQAATKAIPKLQQQGSLSMSGVSQLLTISQGVLNNLNTLRANFQSYQAARTVCVVQMIKIQAAAWCLACDPDYASKGVTSGPTVSISDNLCAGIENSCFDYIQQGADQSLVLQFRALLTLFQRLTNSLYQIAEGKVGIQLRLDTPDMPSSNTLKPNVMPSNCYDYGDCEWACATLFTNGNINEVLLGNGGASFGYAVSSNDRRLEKEDSLDQPRILLNSQWNPDIDEAGVIVQFDQNPGNVFATRIMSLKSVLFLIFFVIFIL